MLKVHVKQNYRIFYEIPSKNYFDKGDPVMKINSCIWFFLGAVLLLGSPMNGAEDPVSPNLEDEYERASWSGEILDEILSAPDDSIAEKVLEEAEAIAVIPHVVKGAFIFGGRYGKGLVSHREDDGAWSAPAYVSLGGGSFGLQIGASSTDYIMVFANREGLEPLLKGKVELGADAAVAAGPVGRRAAAGTDVTLRSAIYSYSRSKGAFAGVALKGAVLTIDDSANHKVYGGDYSAEDILLRNRVQSNEVTDPFIEALKKYVP
jgi:lipid-binding SYLF domain-containing protein